MTRPIIQMLSLHRGIDWHEELSRTRILEFMQAEPRCFERTTTAGHITASAFVLNNTLTATLLTHHRKLERWLQLGGHCDGDSDVLRVARREVAEESGLRELTLLTPHIFDVDIHDVPPHVRRGDDVPAHLHYDISFLFRVRDVGQLPDTTRWFTLAEAVALNPADPQFHRIMGKVLKLCKLSSSRQNG